MNHSVSDLPTRPVMIYDGDCGFCRQWIAYWKLLTGRSIEYTSSQDLGERFSAIPKAEFARAVQFVAQDGKVYSGAEAVFRSLAHADVKPWLLWAYRFLPGFALVAELGYRIIARHRKAALFATKVLWGVPITVSSQKLSSALFLRALAGIYLIAFASLWSQVEGLYGSQGILPIHSLLGEVASRIGTERYWFAPTLFWLNSSDFALNLMCVLSILAAIVAILGFFQLPCFIFLYASYLSFVTVGRHFMSFQWDNLLLESGFLALFMSQWRSSWRLRNAPEPRGLAAAAFWLQAWLLFRLMLGSGVVKLTSGDAHWHGLTALTYHYETQPIPSWTSWYIHQLPRWFHRWSCVLVFFSEIILPFCIFAPRRIRHWAAYGMIVFQLFIELTGNYTFFNLLSIALCLAILDDSVWPKWLRGEPTEEPEPRLPSLIARTFTPAFIVVIVSVSSFEFITRSRLDQYRPVSWLCRTVLKPAEYVSKKTQPLRFISAYGLFEVMTTDRNEIVIEGSSDGNEWLEYEFKWKPGDVNRRPSFCAPHQPRLDWQMWFAAFGGKRDRQWFEPLALRLLEGSPPVLALLDKNPFPSGPPKYLRARFYRYTFTRGRKSGAWWSRKLIGTYMRSVSLQ